MLRSIRTQRNTEDIDPWLLAADWSRCVLIRLGDPGLSTFVMVGENLLPQHYESLVGRPISACSLLPDAGSR
jgi:hypothetical protein